MRGRNNARVYILSGAVLFAAAGVLINPRAVSSAVSDAVRGCLEVIIPSLFAFSVLSVYLQKSGLYRVALRPLTFPLSKLTGLSEELCAVFVLANIGGYPVGAKLLGELVNSGRMTSRDASKALCFCYGSGPSFVIGIAGMGIFGSAAAGGMIFAACFLSSLIIAVTISRCGEQITLREAISEPDSGGECFIRSVVGGARVMFTVCVMITGFSVITYLMEMSGVSGAFERLFSAVGAGADSGGIFPAVMEVSQIRGLSPVGVWVCPLCAGLLSFGGVCVIMQVSALLPEGVSVKPLLVSRVPAALLSGLISLPAAFLPAEEVFAYSPQITARPFSLNMGLSVCVLIMSGILVYTAEKRER